MHRDMRCTDEKDLCVAAAVCYNCGGGGETLGRKKPDPSETKGILIPRTLYSHARRIVNAR
jgi:hypothetical protein